MLRSVPLPSKSMRFRVSLQDCSMWDTTGQPYLSNLSPFSIFRWEQIPVWILPIPVWAAARKQSRDAQVLWVAKFWSHSGPKSLVVREGLYHQFYSPPCKYFYLKRRAGCIAQCYRPAILWNHQFCLPFFFIQHQICVPWDRRSYRAYTCFPCSHPQLFPNVVMAGCVDLVSKWCCELDSPALN